MEICGAGMQHLTPHDGGLCGCAGVGDLQGRDAKFDPAWWFVRLRGGADSALNLRATDHSMGATRRTRPRAGVPPPDSHMYHSFFI